MRRKPERREVENRRTESVGAAPVSARLPYCNVIVRRFDTALRRQRGLFGAALPYEPIRHGSSVIMGLFSSLFRRQQGGSAQSFRSNGTA